MRISLPVLLLSAILFACGSKQTEETKDSTQTEDATTLTDSNGEREPTDDEIREFGLISEIEDGAYPMFNITMEFPERQQSASFNLNIEEIALSVEELLALQNKYATVYYSGEEESQIFDVHLNNQSIWNEEEADFELEQVTGILAGANDITEGDLPDEVSITTSNGEKLSFEHYIDEAMVAVNGKEVTVYYSTRYLNTITYMKKSED